MFYIILGCVLGVALLFLLGLYIIFRITFYSPVKSQNNIYNIPEGSGYNQCKETLFKHIDDLIKRDCEEIYITSFDNLKLYGRYYHMTDGAPVYLGFNGYRGTAVRDLCGAAMIAKTTGQNLLIVSQRAHDKSQGRTTTFGVKERYDCLAWINYVVNRFGKDVKICLNGVSMGAATVLLASGLDLQKNVFAVVADCPYSAPSDIIKKVVKEMKLPPRLIYPLIALSARIYGGFSPSKVSVVEAVKKAKVPILLVHGESDNLVPVNMSEKIAEANSLVERHVFPGAEHGMSYMMDEQRYLSIVKTFCEKHLR